MFIKRFNRLLRKKIFILIIMPVISLVLAVSNGQIDEKVEYVCEAIIYIMEGSRDSTNVNHGNVLANGQILNDFHKVLTTEDFLEDVLEKAGVEGISVDKIRSMIEVENSKDSNIIRIGIKGEIDKNVEKIAAAITNVGKLYIEEKTNFQSILAWYSNVEESSKKNNNLIWEYLLYAMSSIFGAVGILVLYQVINDSVDYPEDILNCIEEDVICTIPNHRVTLEKGGMV